MERFRRILRDICKGCNKQVHVRNYLNLRGSTVIFRRMNKMIKLGKRRHLASITKTAEDESDGSILIRLLNEHASQGWTNPRDVRFVARLLLKSREAQDMVKDEPRRFLKPLQQCVLENQSWVMQWVMESIEFDDDVPVFVQNAILETQPNLPPHLIRLVEGILVSVFGHVYVKTSFLTKLKEQITTWMEDGTFTKKVHATMADLMVHSGITPWWGRDYLLKFLSGDNYKNPPTWIRNLIEECIKREESTLHVPVELAGWIRKTLASGDPPKWLVEAVLEAFERSGNGPDGSYEWMERLSKEYAEKLHRLPDAMVRGIEKELSIHGDAGVHNAYVKSALTNRFATEKMQKILADMMDAWEIQSKYHPVDIPMWVPDGDRQHIQGLRP